MSLPALLFVIHETIIDLKQSLDLHADSNYLGSYHTVISYSGEIYYLVPSQYKAYAAANSAFGEEQIDGSVNDFAYHVALETPVDGRDVKVLSHSGYSYEQYHSLAWLIKATGVDLNRVTTHGRIKIPASTEPRCLNLTYLLNLVDTKINPVSIFFGELLST